MTGVIETALISAGLSAATAATVASVIVSGIISSILSTAMNLILGALADKPATAQRRAALTSSVRDALKAREIVYGRVRKGGTIIFIDSIRGKSVLLMAIALAGHEVQAIDEIYFFETLAVDQNGVIQPKFRDSVQFEKFLGTDSQSASSILTGEASGWTGAHTLKGIAYIVLRLRFVESDFSEIPNVSAVIRGAKVFDPRDGSTKYSNNAALCVAHYLNHPVYGLNAAYGTEIDNTLLSAAANICDEAVAIKAGKVLDFDGVKDVITIGDVLDQTGALTIEARINPAAVNVSGMKILDKSNASDGFSLQVEQDKIRFLTRDLSDVTLDTSTGAVAAVTGKRIAAVWDPAAGTKTIYIDGSQVAQATSVTGTLVANSVKMTIGSKFKGKIQDVRLWNDARTPTEIAAYDDKTLNGNETNLVGYWKLDERLNARAEDATETANDGKIDGPVWTDDDSVIGSERRYTCNGVIFSDQLPREAIEDLLSSMAGSAIFSAGKWILRAGAFEFPTIEINETDARDALKIQPKRSRRDLFNAVRGTFASPEHEYQPTDFPLVTDATFEAEDGGERITQDVQLPFTTSSATAQRLAWIHLLRNRQQMSISFPAKLSALKLRAGSFIGLTDIQLGLSSEDFEVTNWQLVQVDDADGVPGLGVNLELKKSDASIYTFNPATDERPISPMVSIFLPSRFGNAINYYVSHVGFEYIAVRPQQGYWGGTISGLVPNPRTGHLNVEDLIDASADNQDVFDSYVQSPVRSAFYESPEIDIEFDDVIRTFSEAQIFKGAGVTERIIATSLFKYKKEADADYPDDYSTMPFEGASAEGRYFKHRLDLDFSSGAGGYIAEFAPFVDKFPLEQKAELVVVPVGGVNITYPDPFHKKPFVGYSVRGSAPRSLNITAIDRTGFSVLAFDMGAADVGAVIDWTARGV